LKTKAKSPIVARNKGQMSAAEDLMNKLIAEKKS